MEKKRTKRKLSVKAKQEAGKTVVLKILSAVARLRDKPPSRTLVCRILTASKAKRVQEYRDQPTWGLLHFMSIKEVQWLVDTLREEDLLSGGRGAVGLELTTTGIGVMKGADLPRGLRSTLDLAGLK